MTPSRSPALTHESYARDEETPGSSNRAVGLVMAAAFLLIGLFPLFRGRTVRWWSLAAAAVFLLSGLLYPRILGPLNRVWLKLGLLMHGVVNPLVMGLLFYGTVTPMGVLLRRLGKDPLRLRLDPAADTYWIERRPPGPAPDTMPRQF